MSQARSSGYTLIEILMVVTLVAIVSAVALPQFIDFRSDAKAAVTRDRLQSLRNAITGDSGTHRTGYLHHMGAPPANLTDLSTRGTKPIYDPISKTGWNGPYIDTSVAVWSSDGWGTSLQYNATSRSLTSCGPNATCGDADDISLTF